MKKVLSILFAVMLVISMLPSAAYAEESNDIIPIVYNFNFNVFDPEYSFANGSTTLTPYQTKMTVAQMQTIKEESAFSATEQIWFIDAFGKFSGSNIIGTRLQLAANERYVDYNKYAWCVFKIKVPKAGIYNFDIYSAKYTDGPLVDVYISDAPLGRADLNSMEPFNSFNTKESGGKDGTYYENDIGNVFLNDQYYYIGLDFSADDYDASNPQPDQVLYLQKFVLTETPISSIVFDEAAISIDKGQERTISAIAKDANGNELSEAVITYESENTAIATVDALTGKITGVKDGTTNIIAKGAGYEVTAKIPVIVRDYNHEYIFNTTVFSEETVKAITVEESNKNNGLYGGVLRKLSLIADDYKYIDETKSDLWAVSSLGGTVGNIAGDRFNIGIPLSSIGLDNPVSRFVLKLKVKYPGIYDLGIACGAHATAALSADIYMLKADGITALSNAVIRGNKKTGTIDGSVGSSVNDSLGVVSLEAGDYYLVFDLWNKMSQGATKHNFYPKSAKLTLHDGEVAEDDNSVTLANTKLSFAIGSTDSAEITVNGNVHNGNTVYSFGRADEITVKAGIAPDGKQFKAWVQGTADNGIWKSSDEEYTFKLMTHTYLTAVYEDAPSDNAYIVEYYNENGKYHATKEASGTTPVLPENPTLTGYTFDRWTLDGETEFNESSVLSEKLTRAVAKYNANAIGAGYAVKYNGTAIAENDFGSKVEVSDENATHWLRDGRVVAYGTEYTHYIWDGTSIYCSYAPIEKNPVIVIEDTLVDGANMIEYDAGNKKIIEVGILFGTATVDVSSCRYKATSQWNKNHGQFTASRNSDEAYARGYLIYDDGGVYKVIYTDAVAIK